MQTLFVSILSSTVQPYTILTSTALPKPIQRALAKVCSNSLMRVKHTKAGESRDECVYNELKRNKNVLHKLQMEVNALDREKDRIKRWNNIQHIIALNIANVKLKKYSPFFICSTHENCACGHEKLQGRLYYDTNYTKCLKGDVLGKIKQYIDTHNLMSLQEAISKPYMVGTRNFCRHWFTKVSLDLVLSGKTIKAPYLSNLGSKSYEQLQYLKYDREYKKAKKIASIIPQSNGAKLEVARLGKLRKKWLELSRTNFTYNSSSCAKSSS